MSDEMKFKEEELESMADKLLEQAAMSEISDQQELELPKPKKKATTEKIKSLCSSGRYKNF